MKFVRGLGDCWRDVRGSLHPAESVRADRVCLSDVPALLVAPTRLLFGRGPREEVRRPVEIESDNSRSRSEAPRHCVAGVERPALEFERDTGAKRSRAHDAPAALLCLGTKNRQTLALARGGSEG